MFSCGFDGCRPTSLAASTVRINASYMEEEIINEDITAADDDVRWLEAAWAEEQKRVRALTEARMSAIAEVAKHLAQKDADFGTDEQGGGADGCSLAVEAVALPEKANSASQQFSIFTIHEEVDLEAAEEALEEQLRLALKVASLPDAKSVLLEAPAAAPQGEGSSRLDEPADADLDCGVANAVEKAHEPAVTPATSECRRNRLRRWLHAPVAAGTCFLRGSGRAAGVQR